MENLIDLRGFSCPIPLLKTIEALAVADKVSVIVDEAVAVENICKYAKGKSYSAKSVSDSEGYTIFITK